MGIRDRIRNFIQRFCIYVLKAGQLPKHIAIIMDGNRRFALQNNLGIGHGHKKGFDKLTEVMQWCQDLDIRELTVYAFSIENFKRSTNEVNFLMDFMREKLKEQHDKMDKIRKYGVRFRFIGNLALLPQDIRQHAAKTMVMTEECDKLFCNIAMPYTSRDELTTAAKAVIKGVKLNQIHPDDIDEELISNCLYTKQSPNPDLLIRTSGEVRFSDFLLWQCGHSIDYFTEYLWPDLTVWNFLAIIFHYQRRQRTVRNFQAKIVENNARVEEFLRNLEKDRAAQIRLFATI